MEPKDLLAPEDFKPAWVENLTDEEYHGDFAAVGSSSLRLILDSPKAFHSKVFKGIYKKETEALRIGKIIHRAVLEGDDFKKKYVVMPKFTGLTKDGRESSQSKEAKDKKAEWIASQAFDTIVVTEEELEMILGIIDGVLAHPQGPDLMREGRAEVAGYYRDPETGIRLKIKPDFLSFDCVRLVDLKSTRSSAQVRFSSQAFAHRYDFQMYMQAIGIKELTGKWPEVITLVAVEKEPPFECGIFYFNTEDLFQAEIDYRKSLTILRQCIDMNSWPMRQAAIERIRVPAWFINGAAGEDNE